MEILSVDLFNWTKRVFESRDLNKASLHGGKELIKELIFISQSKDEVQLMNPEIYKIFEVRKPKNISFESKTVKIVKIEDKIFLIPEKKQEKT